MAKFVVVLNTGVTHEVEADALTYQGYSCIQFENIRAAAVPEGYDLSGRAYVPDTYDVVAFFSDVSSVMKVI